MTHYGFVQNIVIENVEDRFLEKKTFSLILVSEKDFPQLELPIIPLIGPVFASLQCQNSLKYGGG